MGEVVSGKGPVWWGESVSLCAFLCMCGMCLCVVCMYVCVCTYVGNVVCVPGFVCSCVIATKTSVCGQGSMVRRT